VVVDLYTDFQHRIFATSDRIMMRNSCESSHLEGRGGDEKM